MPITPQKVVFWTILTFGMWLGENGAALAGDCRPVLDSFQRAVMARDANAIPARLEEVEAEPGCEQVVAQARLVAARALWSAVERRVAEGTPLSQLVPIIRKSIDVSGRMIGIWQAHRALADLADERQDYKTCAIHYQNAIVAINDKILTPNGSVPPEEDRIKMFRRGSECQQLASAYIPVPIDREGNDDGLAAENIRGMKIRVVPVPIEFESNSTEFTAKGNDAAANLAEWLRAEHRTSFTIKGHTDERGTVERNQALSQQRAEKVANYLREHGVTATINSIGVGSNEPLRVDEPQRFTREQIWQLNRRVEVVR